MATRSAIGIELEDGSVRAVYCHWDGYPEYNGKILRKFYNDRAKVLALLENGDLSSLGIELGSKHDFMEADRKHCTFYARDRGENDVDAQTFVNRESYYQSFNMGVEYFYLMQQDDSWVVREYGHHTWKDINKVIKVREKING